jgi:LytS/YehU family sensor histidine kinase
VAQRVDVDEEAARRLALPPVSLGELFENAIKHNELDAAAPLQMAVRIEGDTLVFENELRARRRPPVSTGLGLTNLSQRLQLATGRAPAWGREDARFVVRLPLVPLPRGDAADGPPHPPAPW